MKKIKTRDSKKTKEAILKAAELEFAEKGIYGARVDKIASKANVNKRMLYEYYGNKEELYKTVLAIVYSRLGKKEMYLLAEDADSVTAIKKIIKLYFEFLHDNPTYVNLILWENLNKGVYIKDIDFSEIKNPTFDKLREIINRGKEEGVFKNEVDEDQFILSLLTFSFSYFSNRYTLSKLLPKDLSDEQSIKSRIGHVTEIFLLYLCK
jgi:TetR/AcrR family transcriptional regulator